MTDFSQLNLNAALLQAISEQGYTEPTPIQAEMIPSCCLGKMSLVRRKQEPVNGRFCLAHVTNHHPTAGQGAGPRAGAHPEAACEVSEATYAYGKHTGARVLAVYGGQPYGRQISRLKKGVDIVVGTPGRLLDLMKRGSLDLSGVRVLES
ncbi:MAG: DEAD/DEAH box helicase [Chloroflexi bacterium]|nr:DEAD/DEAH box helicase [Chloroflexota bacterium]